MDEGTDLFSDYTIYVETERMEISYEVQTITEGGRGWLSEETTPYKKG